MSRVKYFFSRKLPHKPAQKPSMPKQRGKRQEFHNELLFPHMVKGQEKKSEQLEKFEAKESYVIDPCHVCPSSSL